MAARLEGPRLPPASGGPAKHLVVFLHGYGADGNDLLGLGREWSHKLRDTAFVSPHAPWPCGMAPTGRQWFALTFREAGEIERGVALAAPSLNAFLDQELARLSLPVSALGLVGFSQGAMMALHIGLTRPEPPAAIVAYSGALGSVEALPKDASKAPAILLLHGDMDDVIPVDAMLIAREQLAASGVAVEWHIASGIGHGIDPEGLRLGGAFLKQAFAARRA